MKKGEFDGARKYIASATSRATKFEGSRKQQIQKKDKGEAKVSEEKLYNMLTMSKKLKSLVDEVKVIYEDLNS